MEPKEYSHCCNPFFPCLNTNPELKIKVDIQLKGEKYPICENCWSKIADSEEYTWSTQNPETVKQPLEANWNNNQNPNPEETE